MNVIFPVESKAPAQLVLYNEQYKNDVTTFVKGCGECIFRKDKEDPEGEYLSKWVKILIKIHTVEYINGNYDINKHLIKSFNWIYLKKMLPDFRRISPRATRASRAPQPS